jgi:CheY-like chemotaxis protein
MSLSDGANHSTPIVALSANVLGSHLEACRKAGMDDHIGKPFNAANLLQKVDDWVGRAHIDAAGIGAAPHRATAANS